MDQSDFQRAYDFEWARRDQIAASLGMPVAVISLLVGVFVFVLRTYPYDDQPLDTLFYLLVFGVSVSLARAIHFALRSFTGYEYEKTPYVEELRAYFDELLAYHAEYPEADGDADADFRAYLNVRLGEAADKNARNNIRKAAALASSSTALVSAIVFLAASSGPYLLRTIPQSPCFQRSATLAVTPERIFDGRQAEISAEAPGREDSAP